MHLHNYKLNLNAYEGYNYIFEFLGQSIKINYEAFTTNFIIHIKLTKFNCFFIIDNDM